MKYFGKLDPAEVQRMTDAELDHARKISRAKGLTGLGVALGGVAVLGAAAVNVFFPFMTFAYAPLLGFGMVFGGIKASSKSTENLKLCIFTRWARDSAQPQAPAPEPEPAPQPAPKAPAFNSTAAVTLDADVTTMKPLKFNPKAVP